MVLAISLEREYFGQWRVTEKERERESWPKGQREILWPQREREMAIGQYFMAKPFGNSAGTLLWPSQFLLLLSAGDKSLLGGLQAIIG